MTDIIPFDYEGLRVRTILRDDQPWFVLPDVCRVLDIGNPSQAATRLDDDEKSSVSATLINNEGGADPIIVNEPGLYNLIMTSRKPEAQRFKRWVTHEVLPALRRTGRYEIGRPPAQPGQPHPDDLDVIALPNHEPLPEGILQRVQICEAVRRHSGDRDARALWIAFRLPLIPSDELTPTLAKANGFASLRQRGMPNKVIAAAHGVSSRKVQTYLRLLERLIEPVKDAMRDGAVSYAQARALCAADPEAQASILALILGGRDLRETDIKFLVSAQVAGVGETV